jgi:2-polyprenyl-3-methyl-5-hydroxy-6-metoxy-1,4-benzoquinol methylase
MTCPLCHNETHLYFRIYDLNRRITRESFNYYRCSSCRLIFLSPIPNDLGKYYPADYYSIPLSINELAESAEEERYKIDIVKQFASGGRLLEIGPAYGGFIYLAKQAGFTAEAIEMDPSCCRFIRETIGVKAIQSNDPTEALKGVVNYEVIALWHVIEHLTNPWKTLEAISKKLQPGGVLILAAPNPDAFQFRILGRYWPHIDAPRHLSLTPISLLIRQAETLGLKPIWSTTTDKGSFGWNSFGWINFFVNFSWSPIASRILKLIGEIVSIIMRPMDRREGHGSAYTLVFRKVQTE